MYDHLVIKIYTRWSQESKGDRKKEDIRPTVTYAAKILHFNTGWPLVPMGSPENDCLYGRGKAKHLPKSSFNVG